MRYFQHHCCHVARQSPATAPHAPLLPGGANVSLPQTFWAPAVHWFEIKLNDKNSAVVGIFGAGFRPCSLLVKSEHGGLGC